MSVSLGPWDPQYPVNFYESGDTVTQAFGKHIQEIERIYGLLNALDADKVSGAELAEILRSYVTLTYLNTKLGEYVTNTAFNSHVNSTNPHPNMTLPFSKITGNLPADRVSGLVDVIKQNSVGEGAVSKNGYATFGNGLIIQWGERDLSSHEGEFTDTYTAYFAKAFPTACFTVIPGIRVNPTSGNLNHVNIFAQVISFTKTKVELLPQFAQEIGDWSQLAISYVAFGN